jgi:hypothetical protein
MVRAAYPQVQAWMLSALCTVSFSFGERVTFVDVTEEAGITWIHDNGMSPQRLLPETMNGGCGFFDYNNDGWLDLYFVNSSTCDFYKPEKPRTNALYRNNRDGTFSDVTKQAGVEGRGFGMGVAAGDYDRDGWTDLFVTGVSEGILFKNNGDGTFREVSTIAGIDTPGWSASPAWFDYDNDGWLDLWVVGYVIWRPDLNYRCGGGEVPRYCIPTLFDPWPSWLFRNRGDGTFEDVSEVAGINDPRSKGLGVVAADLNNDGFLDVFQSNDTAENFLFLNKGDGTFEEIGLLSGVAFSHDGRARSGMGVDAQDFDNDGKVDLFVANIDHEDVSVYRNVDGETFEDAVLNAPDMTHATRFMSTFGARFVDFDNDGDHDIIVLNGHPDDQIDVHRGNINYLEKPLIFEHVDGAFKNVSSLSGPAFERVYAGRGLALGDFDNDGDSDLLFLNNGQPPALVRNEGGNRNNWVGLRLLGKKSNREGIGSRITYTVGGETCIHYIAGGSSYQSAHDSRVILGFGEQKQAGEIRIEWPSGTVDVLKDVELGGYIDVVEGTGTSVSR